MADLETERQAMNLEQLPIISLKAFVEVLPPRESTAAKQACAEEIRNACMQAGFFYLVDHGVSQDLCDLAMTRSRQFFERSDEEKETCDATKSPLFRGFISEKLGAHTCSTPTAPKGHKDHKESYTIGAEVDESEIDAETGKPYTSPMHGPNAWLDEEAIPQVQGFQKDMKEYWNEMTLLARRIARALALSLRLEEVFFEGCLKHPAANMVLLRYSPSPGGEPAKGEDGEPVVTGCGEHTDCGFLTILQQDDVGGLQVKHADGRWIDAGHVPGSFVINLGDMTQRWSNDLYKSTWHRVQNPSGRLRFSIPFFCNCDFETPVEAITNPDDGGKYAKITAGEYMLKRLNLMRLVDGDSEDAGKWRKMMGGAEEVAAPTEEAAPPPAKELVFNVCVDDANKGEVTFDMPGVSGTHKMFQGKVWTVRFDAAQKNLEEAAAILKAVKGVTSVEADAPVGMF